MCPSLNPHFNVHITSTCTQTERPYPVSGMILSGVQTGNWSLSPFSDAAVTLKVNSRVNRSSCIIIYSFYVMNLYINPVSPLHSSFGSTKSWGVCCPLPRTRPPLCTAWGSSPLTTLWPSLASGTSSPSWGRWRRPPERPSTVDWYVSEPHRSSLNSFSSAASQSGNLSARIIWQGFS